jgi:hypothetical protein
MNDNDRTKLNLETVVNYLKSSTTSWKLDTKSTASRVHSGNSQFQSISSTTQGIEIFTDACMDRLFLEYRDSNTLDSDFNMLRDYEFAFQNFSAQSLLDIKQRASKITEELLVKVLGDYSLVKSAVISATMKGLPQIPLNDIVSYIRRESGIEIERTSLHSEHGFALLHGKIAEFLKSTGFTVTGDGYVIL